MEEIEVKFINIDPTAMEKKIFDLGGKKVFEILYRRRLFDYPDSRFDKSDEWLRLRDEGEKITLTYKKLIRGKTTIEQEVIVSDFDTTAQILLSVGFVEKYYLENKRIRYDLRGVEIDIDTYPLMKPYLEIEAKSWDKLNEAVVWLGLNPAEKLIVSPKDIYAKFNIDIDCYKILTFEKQEKR